MKMFLGNEGPSTDTVYKKPNAPPPPVNPTSHISKNAFALYTFIHICMAFKISFIDLSVSDVGCVHDFFDKFVLRHSNSNLLSQC